MRTPIGRTITLTYFEPWLLGWCRWEITTDLHHKEKECASLRTTLASGRWKWRGRSATLFEASVEADTYWRGLPIPGPSYDGPPL